MKKLILTTTFALLCSTLAHADKPVVLAVKATAENAQGERNFHVTVKHADEGWDHYADGFEIIQPNGKPIAKRILHHPHVNEQPFTREKYGVKIPKALKHIHVVAHDSKHGYGTQVIIEVPHADQPIDYKD